MTTPRLTQIAEDMARRADGRVLDYAPPEPRPTARELWCEAVAWSGDAGRFLLFCLGLVATVAGGALSDAGRPALAGVVLTAAVVVWVAATIRWAYARPGRW